MSTTASPSLSWPRSIVRTAFHWSTDGRAGIREMRLFTVFVAVCIGGFWLLVSPDLGDEGSSRHFRQALRLLLGIPFSMLQVRRLHDTGRTAFHALIVLTGVGIVPYLYWVLGQKGDQGENRFGRNPEGSEICAISSREAVGQGADLDRNVYERPATASGGLVAIVEVPGSGERYVVSTASEDGRDYWSTAVYYGHAVGGTQVIAQWRIATIDPETPIVTFIRNTQADAHELHRQVLSVVRDCPEDGWGDALPPVAPPDGWSRDAQAILAQ